MSRTTLPRSRPAPFEEMTIRRCTFSRRTMFGPCSRGAAPGHVGGDDDPALHVLAQDHVGPLFAADVGEHADWHHGPRWRIDGEMRYTLQVCAGSGIQLDHQVECRAPIEDPPYRGAGQAGFDRLGDVARPQTIARDHGEVEYEAHERDFHLL